MPSRMPSRRSPPACRRPRSDAGLSQHARQPPCPWCRTRRSAHARVAPKDDRRRATAPSSTSRRAASVRNGVPHVRTAAPRSACSTGAASTPAAAPSRASTNENSRSARARTPSPRRAPSNATAGRRRGRRRAFASAAAAIAAKRPVAASAAGRSSMPMLVKKIARTRRAGNQLGEHAVGIAAAGECKPGKEGAYRSESPSRTATSAVPNATTSAPAETVRRTRARDERQRPRRTVRASTSTSARALAAFTSAKWRPRARAPRGWRVPAPATSSARAPSLEQEHPHCRCPWARRSPGARCRAEHDRVAGK